MVESTPRLLDYFAVYGLNEDSSISLQSDTPQKEGTASNLNAISSIRLRITGEDEVLKPAKTKFLSLFEIAMKDRRRLWLEIIYGSIGGEERPSWSGRAVCKIGLFYLQSEGSYIKIPTNCSLEPVPVLEGQHSINQYSHTENESHFYIGNYDITAFLGSEKGKGLKLVFAVTYCDAVHNSTPINDIRLVAATDQTDKEGRPKKIVTIPEGYLYLNVALGKDKDSFICYRNAPDPHSSVFKPELIEKFPRENYEDSKLVTEIPMFCFSEGVMLSTEQHAPTVFSFILTTQEGDSSNVPRIYITCLVFYEALPEKLARQLHIKISASRKVYLPKAICLISHWPFIEHFKEVLREIYRLHLSTYDVALERVICNLLQEVPLPDQGVTTVMYSIGRNKLHFSRPPPEYLPYLPDSCLEYLFRSLSVHDVITVWSVVMIEKKVLLISEHKALLTYVAMALTNLIFPFKWEQVLIPILPAPLKNYIETIFPYIIGVSPSMLTPEIDIPIDALRVELDTGRIIAQEPLPKLPDKLYRTLFNRLLSYANIYSPNDPVRSTVDDAFNSIIKDDEEFKIHFDPYRVKDAFLEFQTGLLKNYQRFLVFPDRAGQRVHDSRSCFNSRAFLSYHKAKTQDNFLYKVTETSMFADFIESGFLSEVKYEIKYFDAAMKFKRTKNDPSFVKPYFPQETLPALFANDIGFEPGMVFRYEKFPRLNDDLFVEPRTVKKLAVNAAPKPTLLLKDDALMRMNQGEWAKFLYSTICRIWFFMFTACMPKHKDYADELMDLALSIMDMMKKKANKPDEELYRRLIEACGHCGLRDRILSLFKRMKNQGIELDACTHGVYVKAVAEREDVEKQVEYYVSLKDLNPDSICLSLDLEKCVYVAEDKCPNCGYNLMQGEIMMGWERSYSYYTTKCPQNSCETKFVARFTVYLDQSTVGDKMNSLFVEFLSPPLLRKELENLVYSQGEASLLAKDLCDSHRILFWNMALYFDLLKLPNFFLNPSFNSDRVPQVIAEFQKPSKVKSRETYNEERMQKSFTANSVDDISDTSSISGKSNSNLSYTGGESKLYDFMKRGLTSKKSSIASDNQSNRSNTRNVSLMKLFSPYIEDFRSDNLAKGQINLAERGIDMDQRSDPDLE